MTKDRGVCWVSKPINEHPYLWVCGLAAAAFVATLLIHHQSIQVAAGFAPFAVVYIVAQALERFLEPFSEKDPTASTKNDAKNEVAAKTQDLKTAQKDPTVDATAEASAEAAVATAKKAESTAEHERIIFYWAIASILGLVLAAVLGLGLIQSVALINGGDPSKFIRAVDVVVTGLAIGAGTKPLHDLIEVVHETKKEKEKNVAAA